MRSLEKRVEEDKTYLEIRDKKSVKHTFETGNFIGVTIKQLPEETLMGVLSNIGDDNLSISFGVHDEISIPYAEIIEIKDVIKEAMQLLQNYSSVFPAYYEERPLKEYDKQLQELKTFWFVLENNLNNIKNHRDKRGE